MTEVSRNGRPTLVLGGRGTTGGRVGQRLTAAATGVWTPTDQPHPESLR